MNDQALAILNGALAQLSALEAQTQAAIDADSADVAVAQAKLDADNTDIATQQSALTTQKSISDALTSLVTQYTPTPVG